MKKGFNICFLSVLLLVKGLRATITQGPSNAVAENGQQVKLNCVATDLISYWSLSKNGTTTGEVNLAGPGCSIRPAFVDHYAVESLDGGTTCNLIVFNITMAQAGVYRCLETPNEFLSILTVIDKSPTITSNVNVAVENATVINTCTINYNGSVSPAPTLRPYFYWTDSNGQNTPSYNDSTTDNTAVSLWTVTAGRENITSHTCHVYLQLIPSTTPNYANNIPAVSKSATSPTIEVLYGPSFPVITSKAEVITNSDVPCGISVLTCSSTGNPAPTYAWYDSAENVILSKTNTLTLAEVNRNYKCEANNTIQIVEYSASTTLTVSEDKCSASVKCCEYPHDETTSVVREGCDSGTLCDCTNGYGGIILTCSAKTFPNASLMWIEPNGQITSYSSVFNRVTGNGTYQCVAYFDRSLSNYTGYVSFPNGTNETHVGSCSNPVSSTASITTISTTSTTPACNHTECPVPPKSGDEPFPVGAVVGAIIGVFVIANVVATCLFFWYYKRFQVSHSGKFERNNKLRLDRRFAWLKKMMPCVGDTKESAGSNCLWVSLFIILGTVTGIVTFPIWIILANKYEKNIETSALTRRENVDGNGSGENGRRPANISSANHSQPPPANQMNANRREDPYQNESSRENIELNNSHRSKNLLLSDSPPSRPPPAGRPPPPPNKPSINMSTGRSKDYTVNDQTPANPEHTTYADLPFVPRNTLPTATPVQFLNVSNDTYAALNKT